jgi:thioredoxin reductase
MHAAICATGVEYRRLNLWNEDRLRGAGVYYGAGTSEAELCHNQDVFVVGGGSSAGQAAIHFSRYARKVYMVIRGDGLKETLSQYLIDRISASAQIEVRPHTEVVELHGKNQLEAITLISRDRTGFAKIQGDCEEMASRSGTVLPGNKQPRSVRSRRCSPWVCEAIRLGRRGRRDGCYLCPPLLGRH